MRRVLLLVCCFFVLPGSVFSASVNGLTTVEAVPVPGIEVMAYPVSTLNFNLPAPYKAKPTQADGVFSVALPEGEYYLLAEGEGLYNYYGRNPVSVPKDGLGKVNLLMLSSDLSVPQGATEVDTGVAGIVSVDGNPVPNAMVMVYTDLSSRLKGMGLGMLAPTDEHGYFEAPLPAGVYYLVVRVRKGGKLAGPLSAGDLFGYFSANPLEIRDGEVPRIHVPLIEVPAKVERYAENLFGGTRVSGRVVDAQGHPVVGVQVLLYDDPMMLNRPLYVSQRTEEDGHYALSFPKGGIYYLAARNELGGTPSPGELYGRYQGSPDHSIRMQTGKLLENIEISVEEVY